MLLRLPTNFSKKIVYAYLIFWGTNLCGAYTLVSTHDTKQVNPYWSILICTLDEREKCFSHIFSKLQNQRELYDLADDVELIYCKDNREYTTGYKRQLLLEKSKGMYVNFIDDDDDVHDNYVKMIYDALQTKPDCVSLTGIQILENQNPRTFIQSIKYGYYARNRRPPTHINTMRRDIAIQFKFPDKTTGEDYDWTMQIARSGLLKNEIAIDEPYYFYNYDVHKSRGILDSLYWKIHHLFYDCKDILCEFFYQLGIL